jgi:hypothetical protein
MQLALDCGSGVTEVDEYVQCGQSNDGGRSILSNRAMRPGRAL